MHQVSSSTPTKKGRLVSVVARAAHSAIRGRALVGGPDGKPFRFVLNTRVDNMGSRVCIHDLAQRLCAAGYAAELNDWDRYDRYDIAVFMGVDPDIERARAVNPRIRIVIGDPKQSSVDYIRSARAGDLLLVSSLEQREAFRRLNRNCLVYPMFPDMPERLREPERRDCLVLGYHGNKVHIEAMGHHVTPALEAFARRQPTRLILMYNIERLGLVTRGLPDPAVLPTEHVQWRDDGYGEVLGDVDIGLVPNQLPIRDYQRILRSAEEPGLDVNYEPFDFLMRFKASSNPGRIAVFGKLGIPVVTDFTPSACQMIDDGVDGYLAGTPHGWLAALEALADSAERRSDMGRALARKVAALQDRAFADFLSALDRPVAPAPADISGVARAEDDLANYRRPRQQGIVERAARRIRRSLEPRSGQ